MKYFTIEEAAKCIAEAIHPGQEAEEVETYEQAQWRSCCQFYQQRIKEAIFAGELLYLNGTTMQQLTPSSLRIAFLPDGKIDANALIAWFEEITPASSEPLKEVVKRLSTGNKQPTSDKAVASLPGHGLTTSEAQELDSLEAVVDGQPNPNKFGLDKTLARPSQRHKERCRAIAALLWANDPNVTIADMVLRDEIALYGCEGKNYTEQVLRTWISDLCPNRKPGRRPSSR